jgi:hypothetical protein
MTYRKKRSLPFYLKTLLNVNSQVLTSFQESILETVLSDSGNPDTLAGAISDITKYIQTLPNSGIEPSDDLPSEDNQVLMPDHYALFAMEPTYFCREMDINWNIGNFVKYIMRFPHKKRPLKDLHKAMRYLEMEIRYLTNDHNWNKLKGRANV